MNVYSELGCILRNYSWICSSESVVISSQSLAPKPSGLNKNLRPYVNTTRLLTDGVEDSITYHFCLFHHFLAFCFLPELANSFPQFPVFVQSYVKHVLDLTLYSTLGDEIDLLPWLGLRRTTNYSSACLSFSCNLWNPHQRSVPYQVLSF